MQFAEFESRLSSVRAEREGVNLPEGFQLFDFWQASDVEILRVERELNVKLPEKYKVFMRRYGAGQFLFLDLLPITSPEEGEDDLRNVNGIEKSGRHFISISPVGTGDWWGFSVIDGNCLEEVNFMDHEDGKVSFAYCDFLEFLTHRGRGEE